MQAFQNLRRKQRFLPHLAAWLPGLWLLWAWESGNLGINPIQAATKFSGRTALTILAFSLACTPANTLFGWRNALRWRRPLGLYAFAWAATHLLFFVWVDYGLDWAALRLDVGSKPYVWVGAAGMLLLVSLALTSHRWWMVRLGRRWKQLHRLVYLAAALVLLHYFWAVKGNFLGLQGDVLRPLVYTLVIGVLLALRIGAVRRRVVRLRKRLSSVLAAAFRHRNDNLRRVS